MYRRRRSNKEQIAFGFDCFLDLVTNLIGIIVRLILVAWVGARSYSATMKWVEEPAPQETPAPLVRDDPLNAELERMRKELDEARSQLLTKLGQVDDTKKQAEQAREQLALLSSRRRAIEADAAKAGEQHALHDGKVEQASLSLDELRKRGQRVLQEIKTLEAQPPKTKELRYHAPLSRTVHDDQLRFECQNGRVAFVDMQALIQEIQADLDQRVRELRSRWSVTYTTAPVGAFRLRYTLMRRDGSGLGAALGATGAPSPTGGFQMDYQFVLEPLQPLRGETLDAALSSGSEFRLLVDRLDPRLTVVTFHVYPDSFATFRRLRDYLYERGIEVAAHPQSPSLPIAFSPHGVVSRGQ
jgi:hypothetical protein